MLLYHATCTTGVLYKTAMLALHTHTHNAHTQHPCTSQSSPAYLRHCTPFNTFTPQHVNLPHTLHHSQPSTPAQQLSTNPPHQPQHRLRFVHTSQKSHCHQNVLASMYEPQSCQNCLATQDCSKASTPSGASLASWPREFPPPLPHQTLSCSPSSPHQNRPLSGHKWMST